MQDKKVKQQEEALHLQAADPGAMDPVYGQKPRSAKPTAAASIKNEDENSDQVEKQNRTQSASVKLEKGSSRSTAAARTKTSQREVQYCPKQTGGHTGSSLVVGDVGDCTRNAECRRSECVTSPKNNANPSVQPDQSHDEQPKELEEVALDNHVALNEHSPDNEDEVIFVRESLRGSPANEEQEVVFVRETLRGPAPVRGAASIQSITTAMGGALNAEGKIDPQSE